MSWWDRHATPHGVFNPPPGDYDAMTKLQANRIINQLGPCELVADIGCGIGRIITAVNNLRPWHVWGVDESVAMLTEAEKRCNAHFVQCDTPDRLQLPPLDGAWSVLTFQHVPDDIAAGYLSVIRGLLVPGGRFVTQWVVGGPSGADRNFPRTRTQIKRMFNDANLTIVDDCEDEYVTHYADDWWWVTGERTLP